MVLRVSAAMALCLLFSLMAVAHCVALKADLATNASSIGVPAAEVHAVPDGQGLLRLPSSDDSVVSDAVSREGEVPMEEAAVKKPVAEPDPDRSHPHSDGEEELTAKKLSPEGQEGDEKTKEQIDDDEDEGEEEGKKKTKKNHDGDDKEEKEEKKKRRNKHHDCYSKGKKEKKTKKHHQSSDQVEEEEEEKTKKKIHRHHHVEEEKTKKRPHRNKNNNDGNDSDDDDDEQEKKAKRWRKAISRSRFGHGRRSQREEAQTEEVKN